MGIKTSAVSDKIIVGMFLSRDENAISMTSLKYGNYLHTIAFNILANEEDCEECKSDTYLSVWNHIPPDKPNNFQAYLAKIIRNISINRYKEKNRQKRIPSEYTISLDELTTCIPSNVTVESEYENKHLQSFINQFVRALSKRKKYIFVCRYYCGDSVADIARSLSISTSLVFYELATIRKQLKKELEQEEFLREACEVQKMCRAYRIPFVVNDNVEVAIASGADGIHVGQGDMPAGKVRELVGKDMWIGVSAHTVEEALEAERQGADYLGVGSMFSTGTKKDVVSTSFDTLREICKQVSIPVVAIGGIKENNMIALEKTGAAGVALVSAIFGADNIEETCRYLLELSKSIVGQKG